MATPLHRILGSEHLVNRPAQGLRAVDHKHVFPVGLQPSPHHVFQQPLGHRLVLAGALRDSQDMLLAIRVHAYRH